MRAIVLVLMLSACAPGPDECCLDPAAPGTCDKRVYENDDGKLSKPIRCAQ